MKTFRDGSGLLNLSEALKVINHLKPMSTPSVSIPSGESLGRLLAEDVFATADLPEFSKSTMDGYAFSVKPIESESYLCKGEVLMGQKPSGSLDDKSCIYVPTGAVLPEGTQWILPVEGCEILSGAIKVVKASMAGTHWINKGEDVMSGNRVLNKGQLITPMVVGMLALIGKAEVQVYKRPKIGIITMGDELVGPFETASKTSIRDINQVVLQGLAESIGAEVVYIRRCKDIYEEVRQAVESGLEVCDLLITSGSSSMGRSDFIPEIMDALSDNGLLFHGLNIKPGKPVGLGCAGEKRMLALPGNPVSFAMTFVLIAEPLIANMLGLSLESKCTEVILTETCKTDGRETFVPISIGINNGQLEGLPHKGKSGLISQIATADGFFAIEAGGIALKGDKVEVRLLGQDTFVYKDQTQEQ